MPRRYIIHMYIHIYTYLHMYLTQMFFCADILPGPSAGRHNFNYALTRPGRARWRKINKSLSTLLCTIYIYMPNWRSFEKLFFFSREPKRFFKQYIKLNKAILCVYICMYGNLRIPFSQRTTQRRPGRISQR